MTEASDLTVKADEAGQRLDRFLRRRFPHLAQGAIQKWLRKGAIRVDGARAKADRRVAEGEAVRLPRAAFENASASSEPSALSPADRAFVHGLVLAERDDLLALNKPPGLPVQGGPKTGRTLDRLLRGLSETEEAPRLVHRLDKDTSGVLVVARTRIAAEAASTAFRTRRIAKTYWAIVLGCPEPSDGVIDAPLAKRSGGQFGREQMAVVDPHDPDALPARSRYSALANAGAHASWLALRPETGRTHQLRVHCAAIGCPILGDRKYGAPADALGLEEAGRLHLHAAALDVPTESGIWRVSAPPPSHFRATLQALGMEAGDLTTDPFEDHAR